MTDCLECLNLKTPKHTPVVPNTLWCDKHRVQPATPTNLRGGYYLPARGLHSGVPVLAQQAEAFYQRMGLDSKHAMPYDGVSIYANSNGTLVIRLVVQNFFNPQLDVRVHDYPYQELPS